MDQKKESKALIKEAILLKELSGNLRGAQLKIIINRLVNIYERLTEL